MNKHVKICYITCCLNGLYGLSYLKKLGIKVSLVITLPFELAIKYQVSGYQDVSAWCFENKVECIFLENYQLSLTILESHEYDILIVNGWNRLIPENICNKARLGSLGVHAGHPPIGLGRAPLPWNIIYGHKDIEVYAFQLTGHADNGPIMATKVVEITINDSVSLLYEKVMHAGALCLHQAIIKLINQENGYAQHLEYQKIYTKRTSDHGLIDFRNNEMEIYNFIRAQSTPYPGAFCYFKNKKWVVQQAVLFDRFSFRDRPRIPGEILLNLPSGIVVQTGGAPIWFLSVYEDNVQIIFRESLFNDSYVGEVLLGQSISNEMNEYAC